MDDLTLGFTLMHNVLPAFVLTVAACGCWYVVSKLICRKSDNRFSSAIGQPQGLEEFPLDDQLIAAHQQRMRASRGSPGDRLFFSGLMLVATCCLVWLGLWSWGVTPANLQERAFIEELKASTLAKEPRVAAAVFAAENAMYVSRQHFFAAENAFLHAEE